MVGADGLHSNVRRLAFGPDDDYEHYLGCKVAAFVVDEYRPPDELVYVTCSAPGRQVGGFALRDDRLGGGLDDVTALGQSGVRSQES